MATTDYQTPAKLSNLAGATQSALARYRKADAERIAAALDAGRLLEEAKTTASHGEWLPYLEHLGVHQRNASRWMRLASAELKRDTVSYFGGLRAADEAMREGWSGSLMNAAAKSGWPIELAPAMQHRLDWLDEEEGRLLNARRLLLSNLTGRARELADEYCTLVDELQNWRATALGWKRKVKAAETEVRRLRAS